MCKRLLLKFNSCYNYKQRVKPISDNFLNLASFIKNFVFCNFYLHIEFFSNKLKNLIVLLKDRSCHIFVFRKQHVPEYFCLQIANAYSNQNVFEENVKVFAMS